MKPRTAIAILSLFFGMVAVLIALVVGAPLSETIVVVALWGAMPFSFWFIWVVLQSVVAKLLGYSLHIWRVILTGKSNAKN